MVRGPKVFVAMVIVAVIIVAAIGIPQLMSAISNPSESDALGDWKLSKYSGFSYDGEGVDIAYDDPVVSSYDLKITESKDGRISGTYQDITFKGVIAGRIFESSFTNSGESFNIFGYLDSGSEMHLGVASVKDGNVSSSMSVYNRDGSRTVYSDDCKSVVGTWNVDYSVINGETNTVGKLKIEEQEFSIFRGTVTYGSLSFATSGFITPSMIGPTNLGMMIDSNGNIWHTLTMRGQVRLMNDISEFMMTEDGGYTQSFIRTNVEGCNRQSSEGYSLKIDDQESYTIEGIVNMGGEYSLYGSYISSSDVFSVYVTNGASTYTGFLMFSGSPILSVIDPSGEYKNIIFDREAA